MYEGMTEEQIAMAEAATLVVGGVRDERSVCELCDSIRQIAYDLHVYLGVGFLEKVYENALVSRLRKAGFDVLQQFPIRVYDEDGTCIGYYQADIVVERKVIVELKAVSTLIPSHVAQLINYLKATHVADGMLINFGSEKFEIVKKVWEKTGRA